MQPGLIRGLSIVVSTLLAATLQAQTTSVSSGSWSDGTVWSTGSVPAATSNVNVVNPLVLDVSLAISSGEYTFSHYVTDLPGGSNYNLTMTGGSLEIASDTTTFGGTGSFTNSTLTVRSGSVLILGETTLNNNNTIVVEPGAILIVNGSLLNTNSSGSFVLNGAAYVYGDYINNNGFIHIEGTGELFVSGWILTQGSSTVFGSRNDCMNSPCSGNNLCTYNNIIESSQVLCPGVSATTLRSTSSGSPGSGAVYSWQLSTTSETAGFGTIAGATSETYAPGMVTQTSWYRRLVTKGGCSSISTPIKISVLPANGWRGMYSSDWHYSYNWCSNTVPSETTDVVIPPTGSGVTNSPAITSAARCHDLTIHSGAVLTVQGNTSFSIYGDVDNQGTLSTNSSTVSFAGAETQTVKGKPIAFYNLTINNTSPNTVIVNTFFNVINQLTMTTGNINLSGYNFTLGINTGSPGLLSRSSGNFYNGYLTRWFSNTAISLGAARGLFPVGTPSNYRPIYVGHSGITGGSMRIAHNDASTVSDVNFQDDIYTVVKRHDANWQITSANGLSGSNISLKAEGTGFGTISSLDHLRLTLQNSVVGNHPLVTPPAVPPIENAEVSREGLTSANLTNTFYLSSTNGLLTPLPIRLLSFTGYYASPGIMLEWKTSSEENFDHFSVERSKDGISFETIGRENGMGNKNTITSYNHLDEEVSSGRYYYRLKQVDADESFEYSAIISVVAGEAGESLTLYPNPIVDNRFTVNVVDSGRASQLILHDQYGKIHLKTPLVMGEQEIFIEKPLATGVYFVKVIGISEAKIIKVVINN